MRRRLSVPLSAGLLLAGCTFTSGTTDGLPGVPASSSDAARAQFAAVIVTAVRDAMESWSQAVAGTGPRTLETLYAADAAVVPPGMPLVKGAEQVEAFAAALGSHMNDGRASLLDVEVSEGIAYVYGAYDLAPVRAGTEGSRGAHATVLRQRGAEWFIRTQVFAAVSPGTPFSPDPRDADGGMIDLGTTASGAVPREAFAGVVTVLAGFTRAWAEGDAASLRRVLAPSALLHLPGAELSARGAAVPAAVDSALVQWPLLETTELDFTASGRLAVLLGRYALAGAEAPEEGHYVMVFVRDSNDWLIRSLVLD